MGHTNSKFYSRTSEPYKMPRTNISNKNCNPIIYNTKTLLS